MQFICGRKKTVYTLSFRVDEEQKENKNFKLYSN